MTRPWVRTLRQYADVRGLLHILRRALQIGQLVHDRQNLKGVIDTGGVPARLGVIARAWRRFLALPLIRTAVAGHVVGLATVTHREARTFGATRIADVEEVIATVRIRSLIRQIAAEPKCQDRVELHDVGPRGL